VSVIVHYNRSEAEAGDLVDEISKEGGMAVALQADLSDTGSIEALARRSLEELGHIDILVNNAGEMTHALVVDMREDLWDHAMDLHLKSVYLLTKALTPLMTERKWGRIINVSSQVVYTGSNKHAHYAAAKAGLLGFTFSLVKEVGRYGITANLVSPGRIKTDMIIPHIPDRQDEWLKQTPLARFGEPEEVAHAVVFLASAEAGYISGANIHVSGGLTMG
jgi:3-oxoacyl-[acyl-carrier protein] reductase